MLIFSSIIIILPYITKVALYMNNSKIITIFGGSGFLGKAIIRRLLLDRQFQLRIISRNCQNLTEFKQFIDSGLLHFIYGSVTSLEVIKNATMNSYAVINLVGILFETAPGDFAKIHKEAAKNIAQISKAMDVTKLIHISALGVEKATTCYYAKSKFAGETEVLKSFPDATIIRPSIVFGSEDNFFNQFARMARLSPFLPLIGNGVTKFQPVYVEDIANAVVNIIDSDQYNGQIFELVGPEIFSFKDLMKFILSNINKKRILLPIPFVFAAILGKLGQLLPKPFLTYDQVELLKYDNISSGNYLSFEKLGILPSKIEEIVPHYLNKHK